LARFGATRCGPAVRLCGWTERHEGIGAGDGVQLCGRKKALKGEPHERIWHEIGPVGEGRIKRQEVEKT